VEASVTEVVTCRRIRLPARLRLESEPANAAMKRTKPATLNSEHVCISAVLP
jgi:hypothetical protein